MATQGSSDAGRTERESETSTEQAASQASETARRATEKVKSGAEQGARQVQEQAARFSEQAREQISTQAEQQKQRATDRLQDVGSALHETSGTLRDRERDSVANVVEGVANQVDRFSEYLRTHSVRDMMSETERFARREPELFLGGAALLGLVGARFFKSSSPGPAGRAPSRMPRRQRRAPHGEYGEPAPPQREERSRPTVAGTSGAEMPDPSKSETQ